MSPEVKKLLTRRQKSKSLANCQTQGDKNQVSIASHCNVSIALLKGFLVCQLFNYEKNACEEVMKSAYREGSRYVAGEAEDTLVVINRHSLLAECQGLFKTPDV
jgi:hypothetical protein